MLQGSPRRSRRRAVGWAAVSWTRCGTSSSGSAGTRSQLTLTFRTAQTGFVSQIENPNPNYISSSWSTVHPPYWEPTEKCWPRYKSLICFLFLQNSSVPALLASLQSPVSELGEIIKKNNQTLNPGHWKLDSSERIFLKDLDFSYFWQFSTTSVSRLSRSHLPCLSDLIVNKSEIWLTVNL